MAFKRNYNVIDSPGNNFATLNPLANDTSNNTFGNGNLSISMGASYHTIISSIAVSSGKWYFEHLGNTQVGVVKSGFDCATRFGYEANPSPFNVAYNHYSGEIIVNSSTEATVETYGVSDVVGCLLDFDNQKIEFYLNGDLQNHTVSFSPSGDFYHFAVGHATVTAYVNFGQDHTFGGYPNSLATSAGHAPKDGSPGLFYYEPPEGAKALCTANLPSFDGNPQEHFRAVTYPGQHNTGNPNEVKTVGFQGDLIWIKARDKTNGGHYHHLLDSVRGKENRFYKALYSNTNEKENQYPPSERGGVTEILADGFALESGSGNDHFLNTSGYNYVAWTWKAGGGGGKYNIDGVPFADFANTGLTAGDITPIGMSVNTKAGFSIVKYNGNGTAGATVSHGLSQAPEFVIIKQHNADGYQWMCYHVSIGNTKGLKLQTADDAFTDSGLWNDTTPTSDVITLGGHGSDTNNTGGTNIMYSWHSVPGYSAFGSYTGNGSTDGPFIYTGFKPAFVIIKNTNTDNTSWVIHDSARDPYNEVEGILQANDPAIEASYSTTGMDFLSNGFKLRGNSSWYGNNSSSQNAIYMAFAEQPLATKEEDRYYTPKIFNINKIVVAPTEVKNADCWLSPENIVLDSNGHVTAWVDPIRNYTYSKYNLDTHTNNDGKTDIYHVPFRNGHYGVSVCGPNLSDYNNQKSTASLVGPRPIGGSGPNYSQWSAMLVLYGIAVGHGYNECWVGMNQTSAGDGHWSIGPDRIHTWGGAYNEIGGTQRDLSTPQYRIWFAHYNSHLRCFDKTAGGWTEVNSGGGSIPSVPGNMSLLQFQYATHPFHNAAGTLAEVILWDSAIDDSTRDAAGNYLNAKYQIV